MNKDKHTTTIPTEHYEQLMLISEETFKDRYVAGFNSLRHGGWYWLLKKDEAFEKMTELADRSEKTAKEYYYKWECERNAHAETIKTFVEHKRKHTLNILIMWCVVVMLSGLIASLVL